MKRMEGREAIAGKQKTSARREMWRSQHNFGAETSGVSQTPDVWVWFFMPTQLSAVLPRVLNVNPHDFIRVRNRLCWTPQRYF